VEEIHPDIVAFLAMFSATDTCDDDLDITFDPPTCFPLGTTQLVYIATDDSGNADTCMTSVTVIDTTPPEIDVVLDRKVLWPPNHKMVLVSADVTVTDICDSMPTFELESITSNEPPDGRGDGKHLPDINIISDKKFELRAERSGNGDGRVYTIIHKAMDASGNMAWDTTFVRVPHDMGGNAVAGNGFMPDGRSFAGSFERFTLVVLSTPASYQYDPDGNVTASQPEVDASQLDVMEVYVGNAARAFRALDSEAVDINNDGLMDLAVSFPVRETQTLLELNPEYEFAINVDEYMGPVGLHYTTDGGRDYLVENIFKLGAPVTHGSLGEQQVSEQDRDAPAVAIGTGLMSRPNPFNPATTVSFELTEPSRVSLRVYDTRGALVRTLRDEALSAGKYDTRWNGRDDSGRAVATGIYFVRLVAGHRSETMKLVLLK